MNTKFIRKARRKFLIRERALDLLSKLILIGVSVLVCLWMISGAHAAPVTITGIRGQAVGDGTYAVDFALSGPVASENVAVEFERNFIQISLKGVSAYPARTENINQGGLEKVFTYQYQPDLARARVLLRSTAASVKARSAWKVTAEGVRVTVPSGSATAAVATDVVKSKAAAAAPTDSDDEKIIQEILNKGKGSPAAAAAVPADHKTEKPVASEDQALFGGKSLEEKPREGSATRVVASLLLVIGVIGACAVAFRRFALGKGIPFQRHPKVIETIASHGLGPKRSVAVVKVLDQYLVLGMAGDNMSLLANLGADVSIEKYLDQFGGPGASFTDSLEGALAGVTAAGKTDTAGPPLTPNVHRELGVRSSIKKRLAGFKPL